MLALHGKQTNNTLDYTLFKSNNLIGQLQFSINSHLEHKTTNPGAA